MKGEHTMNQSNRHLGTQGDFPFKLPAEIANSPLEETDSVARMYCSRCGVREVSMPYLTILLSIRKHMFPKSDEGKPRNVGYVDWNRHYVLFPNGCTECMDVKAVPMVVIEEVLQ